MKQTIKENIRRNGTNIRVIAGLLAAVLGLSGCGGKEEPKKKPILAWSTISETLDAVSDLTRMDEFLGNDKFVNRSDGKEYTFEELLNLYNEAREENDVSACNTLLYKIGRMIMKAQIAEALYIQSPGQITSLNINVKQGYCSTVEITYNGRNEKFILKGELGDLAINISRACNHALNWHEIGDVYESFVEHLLTETTIHRESFLARTETIYAYSSEEKVDAFNAYNNGPKASSSKYAYNYNGKDRGISLCEAIRLQKQEQSKNMAAKAMGSYNAKRYTR